MNIFAVDSDPVIAAMSLCKKHINKMCLESTQMLVSALRFHGAQDSDLPLTKSGKVWKGGYANHPCTRWTQENLANWGWLWLHGITLAKRYEVSSGKIHACEPVLFELERICNQFIPVGSLTEFAQAMPEEYLLTDDPVENYRHYYSHGKQYMNGGRGPEWEHPHEIPSWFPTMLP
jgi:hypothetical protein